MIRFDPPGFLDDFNDSQAQSWSDWISQQLDEARIKDGSDLGWLHDGPRLQFFNPLKQPPDANATEIDITWTAFPRVIKLQSISNQDRWRTADNSRDAQDEYCEWSVFREQGKISRVTFTSEAAEYWRFMAAVNPAKVLALYQQHVNASIKLEDLFPNGAYEPRNRWNHSTSGGAMHMVQRNNTLGAEIELAAAATIVRQRNGTILTSEQELLACGKYGQPERNSDPHIGTLVNGLARKKADVTLANPIGIYIAGLSIVSWKTPDESSALDYWKITRGTKDKALRAEFEVPKEKGFSVGDISIYGYPIEFGSQIADFVTIKLTGLATRFGKSTVPPENDCCTVISPTPKNNGEINVAETLRAHPPRVTRN